MDSSSAPGPCLDAGAFSDGLSEMRGALHGERTAAVRCDGCVSCCASSQFVHIGPDDTDTLEAVPAEYLVPAPGMSDGYVVMGYDESGRCPMLIEGGCS